MSRIKDLFMDITYLYFDEGLTPAEIADNLNVPLSLVIDTVSMSPLADEEMNEKKEK